MNIRYIAPFFIAFLLVPQLARAQNKEPTRREKGDLAIRARHILNTYCGKCHDGSSPQNIRWIARDHSTTKADTPVRFVQPKAANESQILELIQDGSMPPAGMKRPSSTEIETLQKWITLGAPSFPKEFDHNTTLDLIHDDAAKLNKADLQHYRYLSLAHLVGPDGDPKKLGQAEFQLQNALLRATKMQQYKAEPIDDSATLFRLDLRPVHWSEPDLFTKTNLNRAAGKAAIVPFDLLLLEYPFATLLPAKHKLYESYLNASQQLLPVPYLRSDWLAEKLANDAFLSSQMLSLSELGKEISANPNGPVSEGPEVRRFEDAKLLTFPVPPPGERAIVPLSGMTFSSLNAAKPPFELKWKIVDSSSKALDTVKVAQPFRIQLESTETTRVQLFHVLNESDGPITPVSLDGGNILEAGKPRDLKLASGARPDKAFVVGTIPENVENYREFYIAIATPKEMPAPQIIRSVHAGNNIWRFYYKFDTENAFDASTAVRVLISFPVTK